MTERNPILQSLFDRKSVRVYEEKPIPAEMKQAILEAAAQAFQKYHLLFSFLFKNLVILRRLSFSRSSTSTLEHLLNLLLTNLQQNFYFLFLLSLLFTSHHRLLN